MLKARLVTISMAVSTWFVLLAPIFVMDVDSIVLMNNCTNENFSSDGELDYYRAILSANYHYSDYRYCSWTIKSNHTLNITIREVSLDNYYNLKIMNQDGSDLINFNTYSYYYYSLPMWFLIAANTPLEVVYSGYSYGNYYNNWNNIIYNASAYKREFKITWERSNSNITTEEEACGELYKSCDEGSFLFPNNNNYYLYKTGCNWTIFGSWLSTKIIKIENLVLSNHYSLTVQTDNIDMDMIYPHNNKTNYSIVLAPKKKLMIHFRQSYGLFIPHNSSFRISWSLSNQTVLSKADLCQDTMYTSLSGSFSFSRPIQALSGHIICLWNFSAIQNEDIILEVSDFSRGNNDGISYSFDSFAYGVYGIYEERKLFLISRNTTLNLGLILRQNIFNVFSQNETKFKINWYPYNGTKSYSCPKTFQHSDVDKVVEYVDDSFVSSSYLYSPTPGCSWTISNQVGTSLKITFEKFNLSFNDYFEIYYNRSCVFQYNGYSSRLELPFAILVPAWTEIYINLTRSYYYNYYYTYYGIHTEIKFHWNTFFEPLISQDEVCKDPVYSCGDGEIHYPGVNNSFIRGDGCMWTVVAAWNKGLSVEIHFKWLNEFEYLYIYVDEYLSENVYHWNYNSSYIYWLRPKSKIRLYFYTGSPFSSILLKNSSQFHVKWTQIDPSVLLPKNYFCGPEYLSSPEGSAGFDIQLSGYPYISYGFDSNCNWTIESIKHERQLNIYLVDCCPYYIYLTICFNDSYYSSYALYYYQKSIVLSIPANTYISIKTTSFLTVNDILTISKSNFSREYFRFNWTKSNSIDNNFVNTPSNVSTDCFNFMIESADNSDSYIFKSNQSTSACSYFVGPTSYSFRINFTDIYICKNDQFLISENNTLLASMTGPLYWSNYDFVKLSSRVYNYQFLSFQSFDGMGWCQSSFKVGINIYGQSPHSDYSSWTNAPYFPNWNASGWSNGPHIPHWTTSYN